MFLLFGLINIFILVSFGLIIINFFIVNNFKNVLEIVFENIIFNIVFLCCKVILYKVGFVIFIKVEIFVDNVVCFNVLFFVCKVIVK